MVARLSCSQLNHRNGEAANAAVGANHCSEPVSAALSKKVSPMSWYSGSQLQPTSSAGSTPTCLLKPETFASTAAGDSAAVRGVPVDPAVPCNTAGTSVPAVTGLTERPLSAAAATSATARPRPLCWTRSRSNTDPWLSTVPTPMP